MSIPLVSVIMPVFNEREHLAASIESILQQTYSSFEFLIGNDGSTERETLNCLDKYNHKDSRIIIHDLPHTSMTSTLNALIRCSRGRYLARQDADDISHKDRLTRQVLYLEKHPEIMLLGTACYLINEKGELLKAEKAVTGPRCIQKKLIKKNCFNHGSVMFRRDIFERTGLYHEQFECGQDYDLFLRISENGQVENIADALYYYRLNPEGISMKRMQLQTIDGMIAQESARRRRQGLLTAWSDTTFEEIRKSLETDPRAKKGLEGRCLLNEGRNFVLNGRMLEARKAFRDSFRRKPTASAFYRWMKTFVSFHLLSL